MCWEGEGYCLDSLDLMHPKTIHATKPMSEEMFINMLQNRSHVSPVEMLARIGTPMAMRLKMGKKTRAVSHGFHPASCSLRAVTAAQSHVVITMKPVHNSAMVNKEGVIWRADCSPIRFSKKFIVPQ